MENEENQRGLTELVGQDIQANHENPIDTDLLDRSTKNQKTQKFRFGLLAILFSSSLLILMRSLVDSSIGKPTPFIFPDRIDFSKVQIKQAEPIIDTKDFYGRPKYLSGNAYKYSSNNLTIGITLRYLIGTDGDLILYLKELSNIEISEDTLRQKIVRKDPIGYYIVFTHQNQAYLTACINPRGISTVTKEQYEDNASDHATDRDVVIGWLIGQKDLRDRRCLWTLISTPLSSDSDREATYQKLEETWVSWYEWWKLRFPQP